MPKPTLKTLSYIAALIWLSGCGLLATPILPTDTPVPAPTLTLTPTPYDFNLGPETVYLVKPDGSDLREVAWGNRPQFSADGKYLSFVQTKEDRTALMLYDYHLNTMQPIELQGSVDQYAWSHDSSYVALIIEREAGYDLTLLSLPSEEMHTIPLAQIPLSLEISPDSHFVLWLETNVPLPYGPPDQNTQSEAVNTFMMIYDVDSQQTSTVFSQVGRICSPDWSPDSAQIAFGAGDCQFDMMNSDQQPAQLYRINQDGSQAAQLTNTDGKVFSVRWSPRGKSLAYLVTTTKGLQELHLLDFRDLHDTRVLYGGLFFSLMWSPDGNYFIKGGTTDITMFNAYTLTRQGLMGGAATFWPEGWSPDGRNLLIGATCCGLAGFYYVNIDDLEKHNPAHALTEKATFTTQDPVWSPDGTWIAFWGYRGCRCP